MSESKRKHVFISHHHADDDSVSRMTNMLNSKGYDIRNSSIRAKPANQRRLEEGRVSDATIKRLLRMKMAWASTVVVLIGKETSKRPWVNWEIDQANKLGKRIVGVHERGGGEYRVPEKLEDYASAIVGWSTESIMSAIDGKNNIFENSDGSLRAPSTNRGCSTC